MISYPIVFSLVISFLVSLLVLPIWIKKMNFLGYLWEDMNKWGHPKNVASSGGIVVIFAFIIGVLSYIATNVFLFDQSGKEVIEIFAILSVILILTLIGIIDDMFGWKHGGLSKRSRIFLALFASIPLVVINAGTSTINIPFFGDINLGIIYPLVLIPLAIVGTSSTFNFLAGFNGLEVGLGIILLSFISFVAYITGNPYLSVIGMTMVSALIGFYIYNRNPAKAFPGNSLLWSIGGLVAALCILGNFEKVALIAFIPYILEMILKLRGKLEKQSFGKPNEKNELDLLYPKIYGLTHLSIWLLKKIKIIPTENKVVCVVWLFQIICIILAYLMI